MQLSINGLTVSVADDALSQMVRERMLGAPHPLATPRIGALWQGQDGIYAGMARGLDGQPDYPFVVGEEAPDGMSFEDARKWAEKVGNRWRVPYRHESWLLKANVPDLFKSEWYWTCTQYEGGGGYAWAQLFGDGYQSNFLKGTEFRVRLVRTVILLSN